MNKKTTTLLSYFFGLTLGLFAIGSFSEGALLATLFWTLGTLILLPPSRERIEKYTSKTFKGGVVATVAFFLLFAGAMATPSSEETTTANTNTNDVIQASQEQQETITENVNAEPKTAEEVVNTEAEVSEDSVDADVVAENSTEPATTTGSPTPYSSSSTSETTNNAPVSNNAPAGTYTNSYGNEVPSPYYADTVPAGASAKCKDGTYSSSQNRRGTCSHHGGVAEWY